MCFVKLLKKNILANIHESEITSIMRYVVIAVSVLQDRSQKRYTHIHIYVYVHIYIDISHMCVSLSVTRWCASGAPAARWKELKFFRCVCF